MRAKTLVAATALAALAGLCHSMGPVARAGDLDPPPGPVAPTMRTLDELARPGVALNTLPGSAEAVHVISAPGVYYLTGDVVGQAGKHGILVDDPGGPVLIDGNGFALRGVAGSQCATKLRATPLKKMKDLVMYGWDGCGVEDESAGALAQNVWAEFRGMTIHSVGAEGIRLVPGDHDIELVVDGCDIADTGGAGILFADPPTAPPTQRLLKYRLSNIHMDRAGGDGIDMHAAAYDSKGAIRSTLVNRAGGDGVVVRDDAVLDGVKVSYAAGVGVRGERFVAMSGGIVENSGGASAEFGEAAALTGTLFINGAGGGVGVGDGSHVTGCTIDENSIALTGGANVVIRGTTFHGALGLASYSTVSDSILLLDLDSATFAPHEFTGDAHRVLDCEFGVHGTTLTNLPAVEFTGSRVQVMRNRFVMVDPPGGPTALGRSPGTCMFVKMGGVDGEFADNSVMNIHPGSSGLVLAGLLLPGVQKIRGSTFSGSGQGAATGVVINADRCLVTGNRFVGLGAAGTPMLITGTGHFVGPIVTAGGTGTNCDPDRNVVVP